MVLCSFYFKLFFFLCIFRSFNSFDRFFEFHSHKFPSSCLLHYQYFLLRFLFLWTVFVFIPSQKDDIMNWMSPKKSVFFVLYIFFNNHETNWLKAKNIELLLVNIELHTSINSRWLQCTKDDCGKKKTSFFFFFFLFSKKKINSLHLEVFGM